MYKPISHFKRCHTKCDCCVKVSNTPTTRQVRFQVYDERRGVFVTKVEMKTIDRAEEMRPYKVSDFSLSNLIAVGANLQPTRLQSSPLKAVSDMERTLSQIAFEENNSND